MGKRVYIDGHVGTTGLRIREWLAPRTDIELLTLPESARKDSDARRQQLRRADLAVLCLPDDAAREAAAWAAEDNTRVIDASTAHRVDDDWVYGLPELQAEQRDAIRQAQRVANPGCYASAVILLLRPLVDAGVLAPDAALTIHALSGYSGGGRSLIEKWEDARGGLLSLVYEAPYALERVHKHIPEMIKHARLRTEPQFVPAVGPFRCGMRVQVPLHAATLGSRNGPATVWETLQRRYAGAAFVNVVPMTDPPVVDERSLDPCACNDSNRIDLHVLPHPSGHVLLVAVLDNLGKGASGVAIQCLNLMLGVDETTGLRTG
jgi:N-acetyl-gamma-glutamyl-phosphate reductase